MICDVCMVVYSEWVRYEPPVLIFRCKETGCIAVLRILLIRNHYYVQCG